MELLTVSGIQLVENGISVLEPTSFAQQAGQKLALAGESGAGKSTLLQVIAGLIQPTAGEVRILGGRVRGPHETLVPGHPGVAYLSQKSDLPRSLRVEQVLRYASQRPAAEAPALYEVCRISHLAQRRTDELSGGEQQRVALARLLLSSPKLLLLDEPFSNLDRPHKQLLQTVMEELGTRLGITCLLVSHDAADVLSWADEILVLRQGRIVQHGSPEQIYRQPASEYVAGLFGDFSLVHGADSQALQPTPGSSAPDTVLLVRPEQLVLQSAESNGLAGRVVKSRFFGSYYLLDVQLPENTVQLRSAQAAFQPGDSVWVSLIAGSGWRLPCPPLFRAD